MATCSVNLTNCDLAPRLSLCPDSGLLVIIIINIFNFTCVESEACDPLQEDGKDGLGVGNNGDA